MKLMFLRGGTYPSLLKQALKIKYLYKWKAEGFQTGTHPREGNVKMVAETEVLQLWVKECQDMLGVTRR